MFLVFHANCAFWQYVIFVRKSLVLFSSRVISCLFPTLNGNVTQLQRHHQDPYHVTLFCMFSLIQLHSNKQHCKYNVIIMIVISISLNYILLPSWNLMRKLWKKADKHTTNISQVSWNLKEQAFFPVIFACPWDEMKCTIRAEKRENGAFHLSLSLEF